MTRATDALQARSQGINIAYQIIVLIFMLGGAVFGAARFYLDIQELQKQVAVLKTAVQAAREDTAVTALSTRVTKLEDNQGSQKDSLDKLGRALEANTNALNQLVKTTSEMAGKIEMMQAQSTAKK